MARDPVSLRVTSRRPQGEEAILRDLNAAGYPTGSLSELRHSRKRYRGAVPILLEWLGRVTDPQVKEELVRALSVPWARPAATAPMIQVFRSTDAGDTTNSGLKWAIGNALEVLFDDSYFGALADLATSRQHGIARQMIVLGFAKSKRPEAVDLLVGLTDDPQVDGHALKALAKLKAAAARVVFEGKVGDHRAWVRAEARRGLSRLAD